MAVLQGIRNFFIPSRVREFADIRPAAPTVYLIRGLAAADLDDVLRLNYRCFENGENYTKHTFSYLLSQPNAVCFQVVTAEGRMAAFLCVLVGNDEVGHITTIGVSPEHRRRGLGAMLLNHLIATMAERHEVEREETDQLNPAIYIISGVTMSILTLLLIWIGVQPSAIMALIRNLVAIN